MVGDKPPIPRRLTGRHVDPTGRAGQLHRRGSRRAPDFAAIDAFLDKNPILLEADVSRLPDTDAAYGARHGKLVTKPGLPFDRVASLDRCPERVQPTVHGTIRGAAITATR